MSDQSMTPEEARSRLATGTHGQDSVAIRALETLAGMKTDWGVKYTGVNHGDRHTTWEGGREYAEYEFRQMKRMGMDPRIVHRYVTDVIDGE